MSSRFFAAAIVAVFSLTACQGGAPTTPGAQTAVPAKGQGVIKGRITTAGVVAVSESHYRTILQAGATVPGAHITVNGGAFNGEATSGADGSFSLTVPGGAAYTVTASHPDGQGGTMKQVAVVEVPLAEEPPIVDVASLVTRRTGSIQGVIALSDGSDPEGADVFVPGTTMVGKVSAKGRFALANLPEGTWNVVVQKPGYQRGALTNLNVQAGRPLVISDALTLTKGDAEGGSLKALIRDNAGKAVVGASFTATSETGTAYTAVSDGQGNISLTGLPAGTYRTQVYRSFYQVPAPGSLTVATGETADAGTVTLNSTVLHFGKITGQLVDETGAPVDGAIVQLDPPVTEQVFTDAQGRFTLDRVMPGEYTMRASAGGFDVNERPVLVDNQPSFTANVGSGFVLREPFDPAKAKKADRPVSALLPPNAKLVKQGNDLVIQWEPVGLPPGVAGVAYEIDVEIAPNVYLPVMTTLDTSVTLHGFADVAAIFQVRVRPDTPPATYRVAAGEAPRRQVSQVIPVTKLPQAQTTALLNAISSTKIGASPQMVSMVMGPALPVAGSPPSSSSQAALAASLAAARVAQATANLMASQLRVMALNAELAHLKSQLFRINPLHVVSHVRAIEAKTREVQLEQEKMIQHAQVAAAAAQAKAAQQLAQQQAQQMTNNVNTILAKLEAAQKTQLDVIRAASRP